MRALAIVLIAIVHCAPWALWPDLAHGAPAAAKNERALRVGSKRFTESYLLGEILRQQAATANEAPVQHAQGLGNTAIVLAALRAGEIDVYPEYSGTVAREILKLASVPDLATLNQALAPMGLAASTPLGFNNTYALAMPAALASQLGIRKASDLARHPRLRLGLSQEFLGRADGWSGLQRAYGLPFATPRGIDHGLAYEAIRQGQIDVIDIYSTDAKLVQQGLVVLTDDRAYFPRYDALLLYRAELPKRLPKTFAKLAQLEGRIDATSMQAMNAAAELEGKSFASIAAAWLANTSAPTTSPTSMHANSSEHFTQAVWTKLFAPDLGRLTLEHLFLVSVALLAGTLVGVPLGIAASKLPRLKGLVLGTAGVVQTVPALALLAVLIPATGQIGALPALIALSLYALLPIVRNTHTGLTEVPIGLPAAGLSLGLSPFQVLRHIELPLATPTLLAGVKTAAIISVGTATVAAFIGAGGYGERIVTGLALNDHATLLAGALPAAGLALLIEAGFAWLERRRPARV